MSVVVFRWVGMGEVGIVGIIDEEKLVKIVWLVGYRGIKGEVNLL